MSRKAKFDPDYRRAPWNKSRFAPRYSGRNNAITRQAEGEFQRASMSIMGVFGLCACCLLAAMLGSSEAQPSDDAMFSMMVLGGGGFVVVAMISTGVGSWAQKKAVRRIKREELEWMLNEFGPEPAIVQELSQYDSNVVAVEQPRRRSAPMGAAVQPAPDFNYEEPSPAPRQKGSLATIGLWGGAAWLGVPFILMIVAAGFESTTAFNIVCVASLVWLPAFPFTFLAFARRLNQDDLLEAEPIDDAFKLPSDEPVLKLPREPKDSEYLPTFVYDIPQPADDTSTFQLARQFEEEVARLINATTKFKAVVTGGAGDGGADIQLFKQGRMVGVVECKRYTGTVPPVYVRALATVKQQHGVPLAYLVTTGRFSDNTHQEAEALDIRLIDGDRLSKMRQKARQAIRNHRSKPM